MARKSVRLERNAAYQEAFLACLSRKLGSPTPEWPTVRCWTELTLKRLFREVRETLAAEGIVSDLTPQALLDWLCRLGLSGVVPAEGLAFHILEFGANAGVEADPVELLLAAKPSGVVCYLSALVFHSLTTQSAGHHHVAELHAPARNPQEDGGSKETGDQGGDLERPSREAVPAQRRPPQFGTLLFRYRDTPYYVTRRSARLVPGVQTRGYGPRTQVRITTLEQTLLDALYKPFHCGGPEVVFEAWKEGIESGRVDEGRIVETLQKMAYPATARRLAVMLGLVGFQPGQDLQRMLEDCRGAIDRESPFAVISLLPGVEYHNLNKDWLVNAP